MARAQIVFYFVVMRSLDRINPQTLGVVIIDLQRDYCDPAGEAARVLGSDVKPCEAVCKKHAGFLDHLRALLPPERIIWFQMEEIAETLADNLAYDPASKGFVTLCRRGTPGHDFYLVAPKEGEPVFQKFHFSGFSVPEFRAYLEKEGIRQLCYTGVLSSRCVNATLLAGSALGYESIVLEDLVANPSNLNEEMIQHRKVSSLFYAQFTPSSNFLRILREKKSAAA